MMRPRTTRSWRGLDPGTPAGELFRRYWQPALLSTRTAGEGRPARSRAPAGRGSRRLPRHQRQGRPHATRSARTAAHRCSSAATRNAGCAAPITAGNSTSRARCVDMPSEPAGTPLQAKVTIKAYPTVEKGGVIWAYMGPLSQIPPATGLRVDPRAGHPPPRLQDVRALQLSSGSRRRARYRAFLIRPQQQHRRQGVAPARHVAAHRHRADGLWLLLRIDPQSARWPLLRARLSLRDAGAAAPRRSARDERQAARARRARRPYLGAGR